jgi:hypothetical protein
MVAGLGERTEAGPCPGQDGDVETEIGTVFGTRLEVGSQAKMEVWDEEGLGIHGL